MNLNERLKQLRERKKLTQKQLAAQIGISERVYAYYEQDRFPKDETVLKLLASALGTTVSYLVGEESKISSDFEILARSAEALSPDDHDKLISIFSSTMDLFLEKSKETKK